MEIFDHSLKEQSAVDMAAWLELTEVSLASLTVRILSQMSVCLAKLYATLTVETISVS